MSEHPSRKKNALLAKREALLNEIKYYGIKIEEARSAFTNNNFIADDSSDSEQEFTVDIEPSITELKLKEEVLKTCLQATQELTSVTILESEVNILVQDPVLNKEAPVIDEGVWREVTAECRIDLVPFSIIFYVHKATRMFAPLSYRNLQVIPVKSSHEVELSRSVLTNVTRPSDAIEMIRNYSAAHRSRRTTLARLAEKYSDTLFMEPRPEGGYIFKCAGLMEVQWNLQNKWSPLVPFHHRMVFDLEFMDESYIKIIAQLHKQLIDPTLETEERTLLLAKIIDTCLEAKSSIQNQNAETTEKLRNRRTTLDQEPEAPEKDKKKDSSSMAPPQYLPKKSKPKGKENAVGNKVKPVKRTADMKETENAKKTKTTDSKNSEVKTNSKKSIIEKVNKDNKLRNVVELNNAQQNENIKRNVVDNNSKNSENTTKNDKNKHTNKPTTQPINQPKLKDKIKKINKFNYDKETEKNSIVNKNKTQHVKDSVTKQINDKEDSKENKETIEIDKDINKKNQNKKESNIEFTKQKNSLPINIIQSSKQMKSNVINLPETLKIKKLTQKGSKEQAIKGNKEKVKEIESMAENNKEKNKKNIKEKVSQLKNQLKSDKEKERKVITKLPNLVKNNKEVIKKPNTINYIKNQFLAKKTHGPNTVLATKIPRISPKKLSNLKPVIQDISKSSKSSQKLLQATNIPRLMKKPQTFKPSKLSSLKRDIRN